MNQQKQMLISILPNNVLLIIKQHSLVMYRNPSFKSEFESQKFVSHQLIEKELIKQYSLNEQTIITTCLSACKKFLLLLTKKKKQNAGKNLYIINFTQLTNELNKYDSMSKLLERYHLPISDSAIAYLQDISNTSFSLSTESKQKEHYVLSSAKNKMIKVLKICKNYPISCVDSKIQIQGAIDNFLPLFVTQCAEKFLLVSNNSEINRIYLCKLVGQKKLSHRLSKINITHSELSISYNSIKNQFTEFQIIALADSIQNKALACLVKSAKITRKRPIHQILLIIIDRFSSTQNIPYEVGMQISSVKQVLKTRLIPFDQDSRSSTNKFQHMQSNYVQWQQNMVVINTENKFFLWQNTQGKSEYFNCELSHQQTYIPNTCQRFRGNYRFMINKNSALYNVYLSQNSKKKLQSSGSSSKSNQQKDKIQDQLQTPKKKKMTQVPITKQTTEVDVQIPNTLARTMTFGNDLQYKGSQQRHRKSFNNQLSDIKQFPEMQQSKNSSMASDVFSPSRTFKTESNPIKKMKQPIITKVQQEEVQSDSSPYKIIDQHQRMDNNSLIKIELLANNFSKFCIEQNKEVENKIKPIKKKINFSQSQLQHLIIVLQNAKQAKEIAEKMKIQVNYMRKKFTQWLFQAQTYNIGSKNIKQNMQQFARKNKLPNGQKYLKFWKNYNIELKRHFMDSKFRYQRIKEDYQDAKTSKSLFKCFKSVQQGQAVKNKTNNSQNLQTIPKKRRCFDVRAQQQRNQTLTLRVNRQLETKTSFSRLKRRTQQQDYIPVPRTCKTNLNQMRPLIILPKFQ